MAKIQRLSSRLGYAFTNQDLLTDALTHRSAGSQHNERLEFLGDAVLGMVVAGALFAAYPDAREGDLSRWRASLVKRETLVELAQALELGEYIVLGSGELKSGGKRRGSILSDALEAVLGAIYLDSGFAACQQVILQLYGDRLDGLPAAGELKDSKTRLQEYVQAQKLALPEYRVIDISGKAHEQQFTIECAVPNLGLVATATESSRRRAEQAAAEKVLNQLLATG